jgi:type VI secretion system protein ImpA
MISRKRGERMTSLTRGVGPGESRRRIGKRSTLGRRGPDRKTKDIQIAVWLTEALIKTDGFHGLDTGLQVLSGLLEAFWDHLYPEIEDDDLDYRIGPLEFLNDKLWLAVKQVPLTDPAAGGGGYSWIKWQEATRSAPMKRPRQRESSVSKTLRRRNRSTKAFYTKPSTARSRDACRVYPFDNLLDEKFGSEAPRTADFKEALEDCQRFISKTLKRKKNWIPIRNRRTEDGLDQMMAMMPDEQGLRVKPM